MPANSVFSSEAESKTQCDFSVLSTMSNADMPVNSQPSATVLVVEDDESLRMLCRINLELEGYRVLEAETIDRAGRLVAEEEIDVVLLDLHVGDRRGTELLPVLRAERPDAAICLLSGTSETDPPDEEGVDGFIRKPFELDVLTDTVRRLASRSVTH
jgi:two-component system phosphate regulon response regulator PhoB